MTLRRGGRGGLRVTLVVDHYRRCGSRQLLPGTVGTRKSASHHRSWSGGEDLDQSTPGSVDGRRCGHGDTRGFDSCCRVTNQTVLSLYTAGQLAKPGGKRGQCADGRNRTSRIPLVPQGFDRATCRDHQLIEVLCHLTPCQRTIDQPRGSASRHQIGTQSFWATLGPIDSGESDRRCHDVVVVEGAIASASASAIACA